MNAELAAAIAQRAATFAPVTVYRGLNSTETHTAECVRLGLTPLCEADDGGQGECFGDLAADHAEALAEDAVRAAGTSGS